MEHSWRIQPSYCHYRCYFPDYFREEAIYPGGTGIAGRGFDLVEELWQATLRAIREYPYEKGCPSHIQWLRCGNNKPPDRKAAQALLKGLIERH